MDRNVTSNTGGNSQNGRAGEVFPLFRNIRQSIIVFYEYFNLPPYLRFQPTACFQGKFSQRIGSTETDIGKNDIGLPPYQNTKIKSFWSNVEGRLMAILENRKGSLYLNSPIYLGLGGSGAQ